MRPLGRRLTVAGGLLLATLGLALMSRVGQVDGYAIVAAAQCLLGAGIGLAMAPATASIMEAVPREKAGVGSAVNDTTREVGGAVGVAVLGSILASAYSSGMAGAVRGLPAAAAAAARDTLPAAAEVARTLPGDAGSALMTAAGTAFADAMGTTLLIGAAIGMMGALLALIFIPSKHAETLDEQRDHVDQPIDARRQEAHASRTTA